MTDENPEFERPSPPHNYFSLQQQKLLDALKDDNFNLTSEAYETAVKIIYLFRNQDKIGLQILSDSMATCILSHLTREIINVLMREANSNTRIQYHQHFEKLKKIWLECGFNIDGKIPEYKVMHKIEGTDLLFPRAPIGLVSAALHDHHLNHVSREEQATLLLRDIYGERSEEHAQFRIKREWLRDPDLTRYAHLNTAIHNPSKSFWNEALQKFAALEHLLIEYTTSYYDKVGEIDDILSKANSRRS